ncbi:unnamed protein product [Trichobilharzia regenti]|nr:unnamed protein product [Trichobilharzia regenti]
MLMNMCSTHRLRPETLFYTGKYVLECLKLLKEFENNVAPILNLSGLDVQMVYIDTDSEIKDFVGVLDPSSTDSILVAGDDNLIQKTSSLWMLPVGAVPLGIWNRFVSSLYEKTAFPK